MSKLLIDNSVLKTDSTGKEKLNKFNSLQISEMFSSTIQGEGRTSGFPCMFIRLTGCTLDCVWCDTAEVWRKGERFSFEDIFDKLQLSGTIKELQLGQHMVITGGSPLKQQDSLVLFIEQFVKEFGFKPYIEIENECVLMPTRNLIALVDQWNHSPKLSNSGMKEVARYKSNIIIASSLLPNSWFKFVISKQEDWLEVKNYFIDNGLIGIEQVILMPEGDTQEKLNSSRQLVANICSENSILFSDRLHITIWDKKTGV